MKMIYFISSTVGLEGTRECRTGGLCEGSRKKKGEEESR